MPFVVPAAHLFGPPFLRLYAMKMRLCLFALAQDLDRGRLGEALRGDGAGWWLSTGTIRAMIGPVGANDARAITRATMELKLDGAFDAIQMDRSGRGLSFLLTDGLSSRPYLARYALLDIAQIRQAKTLLELMLMLQIAQVGRMRAPQFHLACADLSQRLRKGAPIDAGWIRRACLPTAQRFMTDKTWATPHARGLMDLSDRIEVLHAHAPSAARRAEFGTRYPFTLTDSLDAILADESVQAVAVLTPPAVMPTSLWPAPGRASMCWWKSRSTSPPPGPRRWSRGAAPPGCGWAWCCSTASVPPECAPPN